MGLSPWYTVFSRLTHRIKGSSSWPRSTEDFPRPNLRFYRWDRVLPEPDEIQARVAEAVTGVVDLDNLLVVVCQFGALPEEVLVVEVQPLVLGPGLALSSTVRALFPEITARLQDIVATPPQELDWVPRALGGLQPQELAG